MKTKNNEPTCGACVHWKSKTKRSRIGCCTADYPMWVLRGVELGMDAMNRASLASECDCFTRPDDVPEIAPHYVGQRTTAQYKGPED